MPRYFFHVTGTVSFTDLDGREVADDQAARSLAISSTGGLLRDLDGVMPECAEIRISVTNEDGTPLVSLLFTAERHAALKPG